MMLAALRRRASRARPPGRLAPRTACRSTPTRSASSRGIVVAVWIDPTPLDQARRRAVDRSLDIVALGRAVRHHRRRGSTTCSPRRRRYFGAGGEPLERASSIWEGGLAICGALPSAALGAWIGCRRHGHPVPDVRRRRSPPACWSRRRSAGSATGSTRSCSALPTDLPWGLEIDESDQPAVPPARSRRQPRRLFHPTFLYEMLWNLLGVGCSSAPRPPAPTSRCGHVFGLYLVWYAGRARGIECIRIDPSEPLPRPAHQRLGGDPRRSARWLVIVRRGTARRHRRRRRAGCPIRARTRRQSRHELDDSEETSRTLRRSTRTDEPSSALADAAQTATDADAARCTRSARTTSSTCPRHCRWSSHPTATVRTVT